MITGEVRSVLPTSGEPCRPAHAVPSRLLSGSCGWRSSPEPSYSSHSNLFYRMNLSLQTYLASVRDRILFSQTHKGTNHPSKITKSLSNLKRIRSQSAIGHRYLYFVLSTYRFIDSAKPSTNPQSTSAAPLAAYARVRGKWILHYTQPGSTRLALRPEEKTKPWRLAEQHVSQSTSRRERGVLRRGAAWCPGGVPVNKNRN